jgi:hypothetical protein
MSPNPARRSDYADLARDPLVRLVMASDGVTEAQFVAVLQTAGRALAARAAFGQSRIPAARRPMPALRLVDARPCDGLWR